ncbi:MAG: hypothetical protein LBC40_01780 [Dysgonamonadaceae bacterium]|jgi:hypothetical protein|nr:hypothetical protein [Dysgonamonadaceae bacterium]
MSVSFIPRKYVDFNQWAIVFFAYLDANKDRFNVPEEDVLALSILHNDWNVKYALAESPATCTKAAIREKNEARFLLESSVRRFIREYLTYNHLVTDADRENMELPVHKTTRTRVHVPITMPMITMIDSSVIRRLTVHFRDSSSHLIAKPDGVHGVEICWAILLSPPASVDELIHSTIDTRSPYTLVFDESDRGKTVYFCLRWENRRGDKGPWGEIVSAIIP